MFSKLPHLHNRRWTGVFATMLLACGLAGLLSLGGCGKGAQEEQTVVLAEVGDGVITAGEYTMRLGKQQESDLPRDDQGNPLDMASLEGKQAFLRTIINKELMYQKAVQLGYLNDPQIAAGRQALIEYEAGLALRARAVDEPSREISNEELEAFYAKMGTSRRCKYLITNFREDAEAARAMALEGEDWDDIVAKYHDGGPPPAGVFEIEVPYGRYGTDFENPVYQTEIGGFTPPILTTYGYWILRVDEEVPPKPGTKPSLDEATAEILDVAFNRKMGKLRNDFIKSVREKYKFTINEDALWFCYQGLPADEVLIDPKTNEPPKREDLKPLNIKPADMDLDFYSYETDEGVKKYTLGDYKVIFDRMNVFQRPKKSDMLGSLRNGITQEMEKALLNREAQAQGYFEDPEVLAKVKEKVEEVLVNKLFKEVVTFDERVGPEELESFWEAHAQEYYLPEMRSGRLVVCRNEADARKARAAAEAGVDWKQLLLQYGTDKDNKDRGGRLTDVRENGTGPVHDAMYGLASDGEISQPFAVEDGRWCLVKRESATPGRPAEMHEVSEMIGQRIRTQRQEEAFQKLLAEWEAELGVTVHEDTLAGLPSWQELTSPDLQNVVPRNQ